jgi:hypothetical protein
MKRKCENGRREGKKIKLAQGSMKEGKGRKKVRLDINNY